MPSGFLSSAKEIGGVLPPAAAGSLMFPADVRLLADAKLRDVGERINRLPALRLPVLDRRRRNVGDAGPIAAAMARACASEVGSAASALPPPRIAKRAQLVHRGFGQ